MVPEEKVLLLCQKKQLSYLQSQNSNHLRTELKITHKKQIHFLNYMKTKILITLFIAFLISEML